MTTRRQQVAVWAQRWTLGLVVLWESYQFGFSGEAARHLRRIGLPLWVAPVMGGAEIGAAILFLIPKLGRVGGYALLVIFAMAVTLHVLHRQFEIGSLLVYAAAVLTCISGTDEAVPRGAP